MSAAQRVASFAMGDRLKMIGTHVTRYGLVIVLLWIGRMKFTAYEAEGASGRWWRTAR